MAESDRNGVRPAPVQRRAAASIRWPRLVAAAALLVMLAARALDVWPIQAARETVFDLYQAWHPRKTATTTVAIVEIDEASLARLGQWPWPRSLMAELVARIAHQGPAAIGINILFSEPDRLSVETVLRDTAIDDPMLRQAIELLRSNDDRLADSLRSAPVVLGAAAGASSLGPLSAAPALAAPIVAGADPGRFVPRYPGVVQNLPALTASGRGLGWLGFEVKIGDAARRLPSLVAVGEAILPALAVEMMRVARGEDPIALRVADHGITELGVGGARAATDRDGRVRIHYARVDRARYIPAWRILAGEVDAARFAAAMVIVGVSATGVADPHATPLGEAMHGIEIHAQFLENLLTGATLTRPYHAAALELALALLLGLAVIILEPRLAARRLVGGLVLVLAALAFVTWQVFLGHRLLLDWTFPAFAATAICLPLALWSVVQARRAAERALHEREQRLRALQAELLDMSRLSAMAHLSSALAHELNQPLAAVGNYVAATRHVLAAAGGDEKAIGFIDKAGAQVNRAAAIIGGLKEIAESGRTARAAEDANEVVEEAAASSLLGATAVAVELAMSLAPGLPRVLVNRIQIQQVVLNLVRNAVEAMAAAPRRLLTIETRLDAAGMVEVTVRDTGPGLAEAVHERLFERFVTSKEGGMGIGLAISKSIIEAHQGRIWATADPGGGTAFGFTLPTVAMAVPEDDA